MSTEKDAPPPSTLAALIKQFRSKIHTSRTLAADIETFLEELEANSPESTLLSDVNEHLVDAKWGYANTLEELPALIKQAAEKVTKATEEADHSMRMDIADVLDDLLVRTPDLELRARLAALEERLRHDEIHSVREMGSLV